MKHSLIIGINGNENRIDKEQELNLSIPNGQDLVISSIKYILNHTEQFLKAVRKHA